jgi:acyl-homoserine-lactone acylase
MRLRVGEYDLPGNGGGDPNGVFRVAWYVPDGNGTYELMGGDSWVAVIEFSTPLKARVLVGQGNATQPGSPHVGDQLALFAAKQLREPWLTRDAIEANLEDRVVFE